ncbi:MAG: 3'-5' exonuclease [Tannerellaceae bacterium]|nr:3'-5' exonuclease [Tannerellaceae bacterium]
MERFAAIDFETANGYRSSVCSVGVAIVEDGKIVDSLYSLIRPRPNFYTAWTTAIHHLTHADTREAPDFPTVWAAIDPHLEGIPLIAHNSPFDEGCLKAVFSRYALPYPNYKFYCTCRLARKLYPTLENHKLNTVSAHCGYDLTRHHHALADAEACAQIAIRMMQEKGVNSLHELLK